MHNERESTNNINCYSNISYYPTSSSSAICYVATLAMRVKQRRASDKEGSKIQVFDGTGPADGSVCKIVRLSWLSVHNKHSTREYFLSLPRS